MHVVFIYPGITQGGFNNLQGNEGSWMHHGLASLSAVLKRERHRVSLIDLRALGGWDDFSRQIKNCNADLFGITVMSVDLNIALQCARLIKKETRGKPVVFGGAHPSIAPEEILASNDVDHIICGEGEVSLLELVNDTLAGRPVQRLINGKRPILDELPFVDRELFLEREEPFVSFLQPPFVTTIAGRGCIYNCNYCQPAEKKIFGHAVRRRSVNNVVAELKELHWKYDFKSFMFHDDCLTEDKKWIEDFCSAYAATWFRKQFVCQSRADLVCKNKDSIKMLRDIGLDLMIIGFESGSQRMLDFIGKGTRVEQNLEAADLCRRLGIKIWANYMLGLPGETKKEQAMTLEMIKKIRPYHCSPAYFTPHPGSRLFDYCNEHDLSLIKKSEDYRRNTYEPKIKNIDYGYLNCILYKSISYGEDYQGKLLVQRVSRFVKGKIKSGPMPVLSKIKKIVLSAWSMGKILVKRFVRCANLKRIILLPAVNVAKAADVFRNMRGINYDIILGQWSAVSRTDDAQVWLYNNVSRPINTSVYRYVEFDLYSDSPQHGFFTWWLSDGRWQTAQPFPVSRGWKKYFFDLQNVKTYGVTHGSDIRWEGAVCRFRLDPSGEPGVLTRIRNAVLFDRAPLE